jgi:hypothetical protein
VLQKVGFFKHRAPSHVAKHGLLLDRIRVPSHATTGGVLLDGAMRPVTPCAPSHVVEEGLLAGPQLGNTALCPSQVQVLQQPSARLFSASHSDPYSTHFGKEIFPFLRRVHLIRVLV